MVSKGTRVSNREKRKMWELYQQGMTYTQIGKKLKRDRGTVSRYVNEYEKSCELVSLLI